MSSMARRVAAADCVLGEGPVWRAERGELWFTDIIGRSLCRWSEAAGLAKAPLGRRVGAFAPIVGSEDLLAVSERGVWRLSVDFEAGAARFQSLGFDAVLEETALMNDGDCDAAGRFVFGSKALDEENRLGRMLSFDGARLAPLESGFIVFNGPAFSPNGEIVYFADSPSREIRAADYDPRSGEIGSSRVFARLDATAGYPDGMAVDVEGGLWNAHWDGGRLTRYAPDGAVDRVVETPATRPTSLAFGGADLRTLYVTSAKRGRDDAADATEPGAGDLFAVDVDIPGAPTRPFVFAAGAPA